MNQFTDDEFARLQLLATIEGNSRYWTQEVRTFGAIEVIDRLKNRSYEGNRHSAEKISKRLHEFSQEQLVEWLGEAFLITPESEDWPQRLCELMAPPFALIGQGNRRILNEISNSLSIVGSRAASAYGVEIAKEYGSEFAKRNWTVISGGAFGIDTAAHMGALLHNGKTIAILGGGVRTIFPSGNDRLFSEIATHGLLLSEVLPTVPAVPHRFLIRNRLIAAISKGTLVVEAAHRSGSLRTARDAGELFRPVMAIPGPIHSPTSEGCHRLINERKAELVSSVDEIMELVGPM
jgi:DNA processing protein